MLACPTQFTPSGVISDTVHALRRLTDDIVIHDEEAIAAGLIHLGRHIGRPMVLPAAMEGGDRAKVALEVATPGVFNQRDVLVRPAPKIDRRGRTRKLACPRPSYRLFSTPALRVREHALPNRLCVADDNRVRLRATSSSAVLRDIRPSRQARLCAETAPQSCTLATP